MTISNAMDKTIVRASATRSVLEKTDRILGQGKVRVKIEGSNVPAPAYTNGKTITINATMDPIKSSLAQGFSTESMTLITALNYHELAHCMFMPRLDTQLVKNIRDAQAFHTFNILQDQIDETRFVQLYDPAKSYFTSLVTSYMMKNEEYLENNYVLISGRLFLPKTLREKFKDRFSRPNIIPDIDALVAEYKKLAYPSDQKRMEEVVLELHKLINDLQTAPTGQPTGTPHDGIVQGEPDAQKTKQLANEDEEYADDDQEPDQEAGEGEGQEEEGEEEAPSGGTEESEEDDDEGEAPEQSDGAGSGEDQDDRSLEDALQDAFDEALDDVEDEVEDRIESVKDEESEYEVNEEVSNHGLEPPTPELLQTVERCKEEFRQASERHSPGWHTQQRQGKLNPRHYAKALQGSEYVYRRWREGVHDSLDFEVVFLLDRSSSMSGSPIYQACNSLWVLRRTFDDLEGIVTTLGFGSQTSLLSQRNHQADRGNIPQFLASGGTYVSDALKEARRILGISRKPLKLCVIITDGGFNDPHPAQQEIQRFTDPISIIGIQMDTSIWIEQRAVVHTDTIQYATELVPVVQDLALRLADERIAQKGLA